MKDKSMMGVAVCLSGLSWNQGKGLRISRVSVRRLMRIFSEVPRIAHKAGLHTFFPLNAIVGPVLQVLAF
jgi:hypothetical protein